MPESFALCLPLRHPIKWDSPKFYPLTVILQGSSRYSVVKNDRCIISNGFQYCNTFFTKFLFFLQTIRSAESVDILLHRLHCRIKYAQFFLCQYDIMYPVIQANGCLHTYALHGTENKPFLRAIHVPVRYNKAYRGGNTTCEWLKCIQYIGYLFHFARLLNLSTVIYWESEEQA